MAKKLLLLPGKHLSIAVPVALVAGLILGLSVEVPQTPALLMPAVILMVYPIMIGVPWREVAQLQPARLLLIATLLNFGLIPLLAWVLGRWALADQPAMLAGLAIASLLPTSGMTISWTVMSRGNVPAAVKLTVLSLLAGSLLMPFYLLAMVGATVPFELAQTFARIAVMVLLPMLLGSLTYQHLLRRYTPEQFQAEVKPYLPAISLWAMLYVIFISTATRAVHLLADLGSLGLGILVLLLFYLINFAVSTLLGRWLLSKADAYALVYSTVLRNLSIALGLALAVFGAQAAFLVSLAFIIQVQGAAWYGRAAERFGFFDRKTAPAPARAS